MEKIRQRGTNRLMEFTPRRIFNPKTGQKPLRDLFLEPFFPREALCQHSGNTSVRKIRPEFIKLWPNVSTFYFDSVPQSMIQLDIPNVLWIIQILHQSGNNSCHRIRVADWLNREPWFGIHERINQFFEVHWLRLPTPDTLGRSILIGPMYRESNISLGSFDRIKDYSIRPR